MTKFMFFTLAFSAELLSCECDGCKNTSNVSNPFKDVADRIDDDNTNHDIRIMTICGCEYIVWDGSHGEIGFTHKGNCKFCAKRNKL